MSSSRPRPEVRAITNVAGRPVFPSLPPPFPSPLDFPTTTLFRAKYQTPDLIANQGFRDELRLVRCGETVTTALAGQDGLDWGGDVIRVPGRIIYSLFFAGATFGPAVSLLIGGWFVPSVGILCAITAVNGGVIAIPIGTSVVLLKISRVFLPPALAVASVIGFIIAKPLSWFDKH